MPSAINLTENQAAALERVKLFCGSSASVFILNGYAGTGKTTLIGEIVQHLRSKEQSLRLVAPTGRAAMVMKEKLGVSASTIHGLIYNYDDTVESRDIDGSYKIKFLLRSNEESVDCVYIVDEASMVGNNSSESEFLRFGTGKLLNDLYTYALSGGQNRKILFVGDNAQLPPVGMNTSPALSSDYWKDTHELKVEVALLTDVVRQESQSAVLSFATDLRKSIEAKQFNRFEVPKGKADVTELATEGFIKAYSETAKRLGVNEVIVVTYTNKCALQYNKRIRCERYKNEDKEISPWDLLIIVQNGNANGYKIFNGMFADVLAVSQEVERKKVPIKIKGTGTEVRELVFRNVQLSVDIEGQSQIIESLILDNFLESPDGSLHEHDQRALYIDFKIRMSKDGVSPKTEEFKARLLSDKYFNAIRVKYGYAVTCHKAQGGEWGAVFVDFEGQRGKHNSDYYRWVYTAVTRASSELYCVNVTNFSPVSGCIRKATAKASNPPKNPIFLGEGDFKEDRIKRLTSAATKHGLELVINHGQYHLMCYFSQRMASMRVRLNYKKSGFSSVQTIKADDSIASLVDEVLKQSTDVRPVPYGGTEDFQAELFHELQDICNLHPVAISNIHWNQFQDQYIFKKKLNYAVLSFHYDSNMRYTSVQPASMSVEMDGIVDSILDTLLPPPT